MKKNSVLLIGAGGHAEACIDVIEYQKKYKIIGVLGLKKEQGKLILNKYKIVGTDNDLPTLSKKFKNALITIGQIKSADLRLKLFNTLKKLKFNLPVIQSPYSIVSRHSKIGEGTIIMHGAVVGPNVKVGKNCILNSNCLIEHGTTIGDNTHVATSVVINGNVKIGSNNFIGSNTTIKQQVVIGSNSIIGMGQVVFKNCPSNSFLKKI
jgi:sugar O-acyltransferase (sialic acid O-acetyltransferase NeuD family)